MSVEDLTWLPAWRLEELIRTRELSPVEIVQHFVDRIGEIDPRVHAFITVVPDHALDEARKAERAVMAHMDLPPLHGIPVSIKDALWTKGIRSTAGSRVYSNFIPDEDSTAAARLRAAGAIVLGKTNLPEFSMFRRTINLLGPECLNPWDVRRTSGGSSGGAAVATAAGLGPIAIGTDGGGSIRIPSSWNGVFGILPSRGRVSGYGAFCDSMTNGIGPITRDVRDAATILEILSGPDPRRPSCIQEMYPAFLQDLDQGVTGMRMAWSPDFGYIRPTEPEVIDIAEKAAQGFASLGASVEAPTLRFEDPWDLFAPTHHLADSIAGELADPRNDVYVHPPEYADFLGPIEAAKALADPVTRRLLAPYIRVRDDRPSQYDYSLAIPPAVRAMTVDKFADVFAQYDVVLSPVISQVAPVCEEAHLVPWTYTQFTAIANRAGHPAASIPCGFHGGLPVGLQVLGRRTEEATVLRVCRAFELAFPYWNEHPPFC
jgi:Asp-tRNA(Asn)/Glu-tRNA(Gln) amidotransferase A subunit family amidase